MGRVPLRDETGLRKLRRMSDLLLLQCVNTGWKHWTEATRQINQGYADRYHADLRILDRKSVV